MIEIQCGSCHTRYRIDERVLPEETPTFKCSRCGHVFTAEPRRETAKPKIADPRESIAAAKPEQTAKPERTATPEQTATSAQAAELAPAAPPPKAPSDPEIPDPRTVRYASIASGGEISPEIPPVRGTEATATVSPEQPVRRSETAPPHKSSSSNAQSNPLARSFADMPDDAARGGENLRFDFRDETPSADESEELMRRREVDDEWKVGDDAPDFDREPSPAHQTESRQGPRVIPRISSGRVGASRPRTSDKLSAVEDTGKVHSAGIFIAVCVIFVVVFGVISMGILSVPVSSAELLNRLPGIAGYFTPPVNPASRVALSEVTAGYRTIKGNLKAFVITGKAENVGDAPLHTIQLAVTLLDGAQRHLNAQTIFCGNHLAPQMVSEMTPREIEFFQKLGPPKNFVLNPLKPVPFTIVFIQPPSETASYSLMVTQADPASASQIAEASSS